MAKGKVVSVLNMKGGVGKTTISAHVMRVLYLYNSKKVLLVDLDPQFNLTQTILLQSTYEKLKTSGKTVYAAMEPPSDVGLFDVMVTNHNPPSTAELRHRLKYFTNESAYLDLIPGSFSLVKYSIINDGAKLDSVRSRFLKFISAAKAEYDLIVIDCNPSSSFITMCALSACNFVLVPVKPDKYSVLGLDILFDYVQGMANIHPKPEFTVILNDIPRTGYDSTVEDQLRAHNVFGPKVLASKLYESRILKASADYTGFASDKKVPHRWRVTENLRQVAAELVQAWSL